MEDTILSRRAAVLRLCCHMSHVHCFQLQNLGRLVETRSRDRRPIAQGFSSAAESLALFRDAEGFSANIHIFLILVEPEHHLLSTVDEVRPYYDFVELCDRGIFSSPRKHRRR